jgi:hypothetical protein
MVSPLTQWLPIHVFVILAEKAAYAAYLYVFVPVCVTSSGPGPNIFFKALFSNILNLWFCVKS